jgi:O-antigen/teichoic acid export membrane protein
LPNAVSWWLIDLGNRYIILVFLGEEYNGIYAVAARFAGIMALINSIFILAWQDHAIGDDAGNKIDLMKVSRVFRHFIIFELSAILLLSAAAKPIIEWTTNSSFHDAAAYFPILLMASGFSAFSAYFGAFYLKEKHTFRLFTTSIFGGFCNLIFSMLLVNQIGLFAVAIGSLVGFIATFMSRLKDYQIQVPKWKVLVLLLFCSVTLFLQFEGSKSLIWLSVIFAAIIFVLLNKGLFLLLKEKVFPS